MYTRSSAPVATSQTSQRGSIERSRGAMAASTPRPEALSLAPGAGGALSVWAIAMRRHVAGVSSAPITLRDRPRPGTSNCCTSTRRPAPRNVRAIRRCARASAALAAGRAPQEEMRTATS